MKSAIQRAAQRAYEHVTTIAFREQVPESYNTETVASMARMIEEEIGLTPTDIATLTGLLDERIAETKEAADRCSSGFSRAAMNTATQDLEALQRKLSQP